MIRLIGYWHSDEAPEWPDPARFVDPDWDRAERARVASYLRSATVPWAAVGFSWCRFRCATRWTGSAEHTDGAYLWPEGLAHYVEHHDVRLPDEFVEHTVAPQKLDLADLSFETPIDTTWWLAQQGSGSGVSFRSPPPTGDFVAALKGTTPSPAVLTALREFHPAQQLSIPELRERIANGETLVLLQSEFEMPRPEALARLDGLGVAISFRPRD